MVAAEMKNGSADLSVTYGAAVVSGSDDTQNLTVSNTTAGTFRVLTGVETVAVNSSLVSSVLTGVIANDMNKLVITGDQNLTITDAVNFKTLTDTATIASTIDGSAATGNLNLTVGDTSTTSVTTGTGDDTINMAGTLETNDVIDGGTGTDELTMNAADLTTEFTNVSNIEKVSFNAATADVAMDISKLSSGVNTVEVDLNDATDGSNANITATISNLTDQTVNIKHNKGDADDANDTDGTAVTITGATDTAADTVNVTLDGIGAGTSSTTTDDSRGLDALTVSNFETVNIASNTNTDAVTKNDNAALAAAGVVTANTLDTLTAGNATSIVLTGATDLTISDIAGGANTASIDASAMTGKFVGTLSVASDVDIKLAAADSTINMAGTLNASDSITGGAGDADVVTATGVTGLTATTGALNIKDVETVTLTTSGDNTLNLAGVTGANTISVSANTQTITGLDIVNTTLALTDNATIDVTAADATGTDDTLTLKQDLNGNVTNIVTVGSDVENLAIILDDTGATANNATFTLTNAEVAKVTVSEDAATTTTGTTIDLGTLNASVNTIDTTAVNGAQTMNISNSTVATTINASGDAIVTLTGSAKDDNVTITESGNIIHAIAGAGGTDTATMNVNKDFVDLGDVAVENLNINVKAGDDVTIDDGQGMHADVNVFTLTGGNSLSTFDTGTGTVTGLTNIDASGFAGNIVAGFAAGVFDNTVEVIGGALATDKVEALYAADPTATVTMNTTGVETISISTADVTGTFDVSGAVGATNIEVAETSTNGADTITIDKLTSTQTVDILTAQADTTVEAKLESSTGTTDSINIKYDADTVGNGHKLKITDVETVNIEVTQDASVDLSTVTNSQTNGTVSLVLTGAADFTVNATTVVDDTLTSIDASAMTGALNTFDTDGTGTLAKTTAITVIGGSAADTISGGAKGDTFTGGAGDDDFVATAHSSKFVFDTITDAANGDDILIDLGTETSNGKIELTGAAGYADYLDEAISTDDNTANGLYSWFVYDSNTYIVLDKSNTADTFTAGTDIVIQLSGVLDLSGTDFTDVSKLTLDVDGL